MSQNTGVLVYCENTGGALSAIAAELLGAGTRLASETGQELSAVLIGSGISGLTSALLLHNHGYDVMVVEQQAQPGGALHRFKRNGFSFDVGFHYTGGLGQEQVLRKLWRYCGIEKAITPVAFPEDSVSAVTSLDTLPVSLFSRFRSISISSIV